MPGDRLEQHVRQFVPDADGTELAHRVGLLKARDYAAALRGRTECAIAHSHACEAHEAAGEFVFANVPVSHLEMGLTYCRHLVAAAFLAERLRAG